MTGNTLISFRKTSIPLVIAAVTFLSACDENGEFMFGPNATPRATTSTDTSGQSVQLVERDVEAPDVFQVTDSGLWDGRPSLGGVWVAHPDVTDPERVIIRNQATGAFVIGALFRRERDNPGPRLQVSSDAAAALEMLAGSPTELQITALRREEVATPDPAPTASFEAPTDIEATPIDTTPIDPIANAAAAIDAAEAAVATAQPATTTASSLTKPFIQIGIFSVEANATRTADRLRSNGAVPTVLQQESQGRPFWRVIVGPSTNSADRARLLEQIKALGFSDAYFVTN